MNLLLDTHALLWYLQDDPNLSDAIADILESMDNKLYLSIASLWEIAIKLGIGKLELQSSFDELHNALTQFDIETLPILFEDTRNYLSLPLHHRDLFDRMLDRCPTTGSRGSANQARLRGLEQANLAREGGLRSCSRDF